MTFKFTKKQAREIAYGTKKNPKGADPLEKAIEGAVCDHAKALGCLVYKFTSPSRRSVPDRLFILPDGKGVFFIEFKRRGQKPTAGQEIEIAKIRAKGTRVFVIDNKDDGKWAVEYMLDSGHGMNSKTITMADPAFN